jgi:putative nucleotidyltransferase-like protein
LRANDALYGDLVRPALLSLLRALPEEPGQFDAALEPIEAGGWKMWEEFFFYATYHGILGAIDSELTRNPRLSARVREAAERRRALELLWHAHVMKGLEDAVRVLSKAGIQTCALKGPVLAGRLYGNTAARHCIDIDLLVGRSDIDRALQAFAAAGYSSETGQAATYLLNYGHHFNVTRAGTVAIELHFRPYAGFGVELPADLFLARAEPIRLANDLPVLVLSPEDEFIYLAAHAAGHSFIRFVWLYDLKLFVRRYPTLDWPEVARRSDAFGLATVVAYTMRLLKRWLDVRVPHLPPRLTRLGARSRIADRLLTEASTPGDKSFRDNLSGLFFTSMLCDTSGAAAWLLQHHLWRATRRRLHRLAPSVLPDRWSA